MKNWRTCVLLLGLLLAAQLSHAQEDEPLVAEPLDEGESSDDSIVSLDAIVDVEPGVKAVTTVSTDIEEEEERPPILEAESAVAKRVRPDTVVEDVYPAALVEKVRSAADVKKVRSAAVVEEGLPAVAAVADVEELESVPVPAAAATGKSKFTEFNEKWLEETEEMAADFVSTPAMERLKAGSFGEMAAAELGFDPVAAITTGVHATLARCLHTLNVIRTIGMFHEGTIPRKVVVPNCDHRKFKLLFVLEDTADWGHSQRLQSELSAVNARLFPFAQQMAKRGHTVQVADVDHFDQVEMKALDAIIFVKVLDRAYEALQNSSVPLLWDHVDQWDRFPFWDLSSWPLKERFTGIFTAGRVAKLAFDRAGIPAHVVYHNHGNTAKMHRPDRSGPVKVIALQGDYHQNEKSDIYPFLQSYCKENKITLRHGAYTGTGWEVQEYGTALASTTADPANLLGLSMGFSTVDVAVIWPKAYVQFHICYKPTNRLAHFASLGIPTIVYPFASYIDILVDFGYPLVAENLDDAALLLDRLVASPELRQEASKKLLEIAKYLSVEELAQEYEQGLCAFLSPEALQLRQVTPVDVTPPLSRAP